MGRSCAPARARGSRISGSSEECILHYESKHQRNPKRQIPILPAKSLLWSLGFGTFLVFGAWCLVFRPVGLPGLPTGLFRQTVLEFTDQPGFVVAGVGAVEETVQG